MLGSWPGRPSSPAGSGSIAEDGYLLVPSLLAADVVAALAARLDELARAIIAKADAAAGEQWEEAGVVRVRLDPADPGYARLVRHPLLFSAADAVIGPGCRVDGLSLRAPLPGCGHQGLHPDFFPGTAPAGRGRYWPPCGASPDSPGTTGRCG
jgi:hypothetical protein